MRRAYICLSVTLTLLLSASAQAQEANGEVVADTDLYRAPKDGGVRRWQVAPGDGLRLYDSPSSGATVIDALPDHAVLSNFGCADAGGEVWCEIRPFRGGVRGFALAAGLQPAQGPDQVIATGIDNSERRAKARDFDTTGAARCAQERGQTMGECGLGVARGSGGDATVVATFSNGFARRLNFVHGEFVSANATMSGTGKDTDWRMANGVHFIRVDDQRYEISDSLIFGD